MYNEVLLNEFYNPENVGVIKGASAVGKIVSDVCGEIVKIFVSVENEMITDAKFQTYGCAAAIAATSMATKTIIGLSLEEAEKITAKDILEMIGGTLPEKKEYIPALVEETIKDMIADYRQNHK